MSSASKGNKSEAIQAVLLAGGRGTRLYPYSAVLPKPLVPLGDTPVMEVLIRRLRMQDLTNLAVCTGYLSELIQAFFNDGKRWGVNLSYTREDEPLGTAGPMKLVENLSDPFVLMNGDLLTTLDIQAMIEHHKQTGAGATIAVYPREVKIDFGVLDITEDGLLGCYREKPHYDFNVSMGVYVFERWVVEQIRPKERVDIPELMQRVIHADRDVACYQADCFWLDIGRPDDYATAQQMFEENRSLFLPEGSE